MQDIRPPKYRPVKTYDVIGHLPASDRTPDMFYGGDPSSAKVAALSFLTLWFLNPEIQKILKERVDTIICGLSPLSNGMRLETAFSKATDNATPVTSPTIKYDFGNSFRAYTGTCRYPISQDGKLIKKGLIAIYATSIKDDQRNGYSARWNEKAKSPHTVGDMAEEDHEYTSIYYRRPQQFDMYQILEALHMEPLERDARLADILKNEFSDIDSLYDMVPKRVVHEIGHILEHCNIFTVTKEIADEVLANINSKTHLSYYRTSVEAVAELAGIALLEQVRKNAGLDFGIPTTMLDKIVPNAFSYIDEKIERFSQGFAP